MKRMRVFAMMLVIALVGAWLFSGLLICVHERHQCTGVICACPESDCPHDRCDICKVVNAGKSLLVGIVIAGAAETGHVLCICMMRIQGGERLACMRKTLVELRTMLLC